MTAREARAALKIAKAVYLTVEVAGAEFRNVRISKKEGAALFEGMDGSRIVRAELRREILIIGRQAY